MNQQIKVTVELCDGVTSSTWGLAYLRYDDDGAGLVEVLRNLARSEPDGVFNELRRVLGVEFEA